MSKIRYPPRLVILGYVHIFLWLIVTFFVQITEWPEDDKYKPIYYDNLNWACEINFSHTYNPTTKEVDQHSTKNETCGQQGLQPKVNSTLGCHNLFNTYYCDILGADKNNTV